MVLALTGLVSHQNLPSRTILVLNTLLEKLLSKSSLAQNHRFLCLSNWDSIVINMNYIVLNSVPTCLLIVTMKTLRRTNSSRKKLRPQLSQALLDRERHFKRIYSSTFERCREQKARSNAYRNRFKLGHHLDVGEKVIYENHRQDLSKSQKLQQRRLSPFTVTKRVTSTTFQIQDDKDPSIIKTVHLTI